MTAMRPIIAVAATLAATPAFAAGGPFFSLANTDFVVLLAFIVFIGVLVYFRVPGLLGGMLDKRAETIRSELEEAKALREEAQTILASYERKHKEVAEQSERIVKHAREEAAAAAEDAKEELKRSIARRMQAAEDQIASAESAAIKEVRDTAVTVAVAAAREVIAKKMSAAEANKLVDAAIADVEMRLN
jgi:F-type H+-transporting ATPase subunit b